MPLFLFPFWLAAGEDVAAAGSRLAVLACGVVAIGRSTGCGRLRAAAASGCGCELQTFEILEGRL